MSGRDPGPAAARQPVHTVYVAAHRFRADAAAEHGRLALAALAEHAPDEASFAAAFGVEERHAAAVRRRVVGRLTDAPVEDLRVDFEDGFGRRSDAEEDAEATRAASELARGAAAGMLPPSVGARVKSLTDGTRARALRTVGLLLAGVVGERGAVPGGFRITLPKVTTAAEVAGFARFLEGEEARLGIAEGSLRFEAMVELPDAVLGPDGASPLRAWVAAGAGRLVGVHLGVYDYTASLGIPAPHRGIRHPACDFARHVMQVALAGTGVALSDGSTARLPIGSRDEVHRAWRAHADDVRHSLRHGWWQGWDLHPAQLASRWAAVHGFLAEGLEEVLPRLRALREVGGDDPHAAEALEGFLARAVACGAADAGSGIS